VNSVSRSAKSTLEDFGTLARNVDGKVNPVLRHIDATLETAKAAIRDAEKTLANTEKLTSPGSPVMQSVIKTLDGLSRAARSIRVFK
jgi:ABC-type transporter Mla subunit MlaD